MANAIDSREKQSSEPTWSVTYLGPHALAGLGRDDCLFGKHE